MHNVNYNAADGSGGTLNICINIQPFGVCRLRETLHIGGGEMASDSSSVVILPSGTIASRLASAPPFSVRT